LPALPMPVPGAAVAPPQEAAPGSALPDSAPPATPRPAAALPGTPAPAAAPDAQGTSPAPGTFPADGAASLGQQPLSGTNPPLRGRAAIAALVGGAPNAAQLMLLGPLLAGGSLTVRETSATVPDGGR